jgi:hypothetical protein
MIATLKHQQVDLWEAWVDLQTTQGFATLYVIGNVYTDKELTQPYFIKKAQDDPDLLLLEIQPAICSEEGYETEIMYAEELDNLCQYATIQIYAGEELVTTISDIETIC